MVQENSDLVIKIQSAHQLLHYPVDFSITNWNVLIAAWVFTVYCQIDKAFFIVRKLFSDYLVIPVQLIIVFSAVRFVFYYTNESISMANAAQINVLPFPTDLHGMEIEIWIQFEPNRFTEKRSGEVVADSMRLLWIK